jgi:hypothetical protein
VRGRRIDIHLKTGRRRRDRIASLRRALRVAQHEHRNGVAPARIAATQGFAQIGLGVVEPQLDGFERSVHQALIEQHQLTQVAARNAKSERRIADIGVVANKRRGDNLDVQMRDGCGNPFGRQRHGQSP